MSSEDPISPGFHYVFIKPVLAVLIVGGLIGLGLLGMSRMAKEGNPDVDIPIVMITTTWPGASASLMEREVTSEIERSLKGIDRLKLLSSVSQDSLSMVRVEFEATAPSQEALQAVRDEISEAEARLPAEADKPSVSQIRITDRPVVAYVLHGEVDDAILAGLAEELEEGLERLSGVRDAETSGHREEIVQVLLRPDRVDQLGLSTAQIAQAIDKANVDASVGAVESPEMRARLDVEGRFDTLDELREVAVSRSRPGGSPVRLGRIAEVRQDLEPRTQTASLSVGGGKFEKAVVLSLYKSPGVDTVRLIERATAFVEAWEQRASWPHGVNVTRIDDETVSIMQALSGTLTSGWQACIAVFVVLFLLLSWREAVIAGIAIPITFLGALAVVYLLGNTLNELVLVGMIIALGLMVDVFILVMEGMHEGLSEHNLTFPQAVRRTVRTYALPALAGQLTTIFALAPLYAIGGTMGKFVQVIPTTVIAALVVSFSVAFLAALPLSRPLLDRKMKHGPSMVDRGTARLSAGLSALLRRTVLASRLNAVVFVALSIAMLVLAGKMGGLLDFVLLPDKDDPRFGLTVELEPDATLLETDAVAAAVGAYLRQQPEVQTIAAYVGRKSPMDTSGLGSSSAERFAGFSAELVPLEDRDAPAFVLSERWRADLDAIVRGFPGAIMRLHTARGGPGGGAPIQIALYADTVSELRTASEQVQRLLSNTVGVSEVSDDLGPPEPGIRLRPRVEILDLYGLDPSAVANQLRYALDDVKVATFDREGTEEPLDVRLGMRWPSRNGVLGSPREIAEALGVSVVDSKGRRHSLETLHEVTIRDASSTITHRDGRRAVLVSAQLVERTAASVMAEVQPALDTMAKEWGERVEVAVAGEAQDTTETFADVPAALGMAVVLVFGVLALLFGSFKQPLIIMGIVPLALIGTLVGYYLVGLNFSFPAMMGVISLIGIVVNDSIVMVSAMNDRRRAGASPAEAASRGAGDRLRPVVSTTLTTVGGMVPLALTTPMWAPLAWAVTFGLLGANLIAFAVIPALYLLLPSPVD
ncbi:MAG: multidrug efflux pump subunit AcrB [Myxococcota bacterium]|jgi:multidrug efflux pump subunit AcrB